MVSKQDIEKECNIKIKNLKKERVKLEDKHKEFEREDIAQKENTEECEMLTDKRQKFEGKKYIGNFGNRNNWYHGEIPLQFIFSDDLDDERLIKEALTQIMDENLKIIEETDEYKELISVIVDFHTYQLSEEHTKIHERLDDIKYEIMWSEDKIQKVQSKGGLIEVTKNLAKQKRGEEENKKKQAKIIEYKKKIIEFNKKT